jgi:hypothetical protein
MKKLSQLPVWLRWLLVPVVSILSLILVGLIAALFFWVQIKFLGVAETGLYLIIQKNVFAGVIGGFLVVYSGVLVAPSGKKITSLALSALFVLMGWQGLLIAIEKGDLWGVAEVFFVIVGLGVGIYTVFEAEHKTKSLSK